MAKGYDLARERENKLNLFGKNLARRAKSKCELCSCDGEKLNIHEIKPIEEEPDYERVLLLCNSCIEKLTKLDKLGENDFRFLNETIWSETPIIKALSVKIAYIIKEKYSWVEDLLDTIWIEDEVNILIDQIEL